MKRLLLFLWLWVPGLVWADRVVVVVWPFEDVSFLPQPPGQEDWGALAMEVLTGVLLEAGGIEVVERARLDRILEELNLSCSGLAERTACRRVGRIVGARKMVFGEYLYLPDGSTRFLVRVVDVETSLIDAGWEAVVPPGGDPYAVLSRLGCDVARYLAQRKGPASHAGPSRGP